MSQATGGSTRRAPLDIAQRSDRWSRLGNWEVWLPVFVALALTVPALGQGSLVSDEALYAAVAREALERWPALDLTILGEPYGNKPPLGFWAMALSFAVLGVDTFAARLPSALAAALVCGLVASLALRTFGRGAGFVAGVCIAIAPTWVRYSSEARLDAPMLALGLLGVHACLAQRASRPRAAPWLAVAAGAAFGAAALVKGPIAIVPLAVGLVVLRGRRGVLLAVATTIVVAGSWPLAMSLSAHGAVWRDLVSAEVTAHAQIDGGRDLLALARHTLVGGAPASIVALCGLFALRRRFRTPARIAGVWLGLAAICAVAPSPSYSRYVLPLLPGLAFLAGGAFRAWMERDPVRLERVLRTSSAVVATAAVVAVILPLGFGMRLHRDQARLLAGDGGDIAQMFAPDARVPLIGDKQNSERGTIAFHLRRKRERWSPEDLAGWDATQRPRTVLAVGAETHARLGDLGYRVVAAQGPWALLREHAATEEGLP